jgi:hypothetical protein
VLLIAKDMNI